MKTDSGKNSEPTGSLPKDVASRVADSPRPPAPRQLRESAPAPEAAPPAAVLPTAKPKPALYVGFFRVR